MNTTLPSQHQLLRGLLAALALGSSQLAFGQAAPAAPAPKEELIKLAEFTITENPHNLCVSKQALSGTRVAMNRTAPDDIYARYSDYRVTEGALEGFGFNIGIDYHSDTVGESVTGLTTTKPLAGVTARYPGVAAGFGPQEASYKIEARPLVNLGFTYRAKDWTARIQINHATDKDYVYAGGSRTSVVAGDPRKIRRSVTDKF